MRKLYKKRMRMPSMLDPHLADIERWLAAEPRLTALAILGRLAEHCSEQFGPSQHTIVQRLLRSLIGGMASSARLRLAFIQPFGSWRHVRRATMRSAV